MDGDARSGSMYQEISHSFFQNDVENVDIDRRSGFRS